MSDLPAIVGLSGTITVLGETYNWKSPTVRDYAELEVKLRDLITKKVAPIQRANILIATAEPPMTKAQQEALLSKAVDEQIGMERLGAATLANIYQFAEGEAITLWYYLRHTNQSLSYERILDWPGHIVTDTLNFIIREQTESSDPSGEKKSAGSEGNSV